MIERVTFAIDGENIVGNLHLPISDPPLAAIVVAGPMTSVKEQVTGTYAAELARRGFAALALDHRHYGESDGQPRQYEHHMRKVEDLTAALTFLERRDDLPSRTLAAVGVCLGGGYAVTLAADNRIRAVGCVAGYYRDPRAMRANDLAGFEARVAQGVEARKRFEATGEVVMIPAAALQGDAAMSTADTVDYYTRRAAVANYRNAFAVMSREHFLPFDVQAAAPKLRVPFAMVHSEAALSPPWARSFYAAVASPKRELWLKSQGQTDFYDDPRLIEPAVEWIASRLAEAL